MMERLTERIRNYNGSGISRESLIDGDDGNATLSDFASKIITKLADYEDLEEQGLLVKLPCKVGDTLYKIRYKYSSKSIVELKVIEITISRVDNVDVIQIVCNDTLFPQNSHYTLEEIGKYVFLTREDAEQALVKMGGKDGV
jgi:hypothetical protein